MKIQALCMAGVGLLGTLALPALAHDQVPQQAQQQTPQQADQLVVVRDAETGQLRAPTAAEAASLQASRLQASSTLQRGAEPRALNLKLKRHASGAVGVRATEEMASYAVVSRRPDGTLVEACFESRSAADQAMSGTLPPAPAKQQAEEK